MQTRAVVLKSCMIWIWRLVLPDGDRDDRGPEPLGAVMQTEAAGEQAVAEGDLDHVVGGHAGAAVRIRATRFDQFLMSFRV